MRDNWKLLDQAELRQLGLNASDKGNNHLAIAYFKEAVSRPDADGTARFILGMHYAQIKMYDSAIGEMEAAIALDPGLTIARLQLGLLWLTNGQARQAMDMLAPLQLLPETDALRYFGQGLTHLAHDQLPEASASLVRGIELNVFNPALNVDMQKFVDRIAEAAASGPTAPPGAPATESETEKPDDDTSVYRHLLAAAYGGNTTN